ncbi:uncharacterized protein LOC119280273 [Triticum dicoccoides]|uniref:uncharacterized protein LOC119280273 n=1 Tax=Triticum dicoccoides TaxID=85692 RepID=UPI00188ECDFB|nr:uncharacterized protein LOC119280273 [Triticum dicoccoides]
MVISLHAATALEVLLLLPRPISIGVPSGQPAACSSSSGQPPLASPPPGPLPVPRILLPQLQQPAASSTSIGAHKWGQWNSGESHSVQILAYARGLSEFFWMPCLAIDMNGKAFEGYSKQAAGS